jgi:FtsP/CotA-like multicopper oxidase with cupredoxin domain
MDIEFTMPRGAWSLHEHNGLPGAADLRVVVGQGAQPNAADRRADAAIDVPVLDLAEYGTSGPAQFTAQSRFDRVFRLVLQSAPGKGGMGNMGGMSGMDMTDAYTINGAAFMQATPLTVRRGQRVEIAFVNQSNAVHPMHLHGHRMQVLVLNGVRVAGAPLVQDTVLVLPHATTVVAFVADNPGVWMLHCHELHHAAAGMDTLLAYEGSPRLAQLGGVAGNNPE